MTSFAEAERERALRWANATPQERIEAVEALLDLALEAGVLARVRADRQSRVDEVFVSPSTEGS